MPQLDHLPEGILSDLVHPITRSTLPDVAATCRLFYRIAIPQLYYCVWYQTNPSSAEAKLPRATICTNSWISPHEPSNIFDFPSFARTISKFLLLRPLVKVTVFHVSNHDAKTVDLSAFFYAFGGVKDPFLPSLHSRSAYPVHPTIALKSVAIFSRDISGSSYWNIYDVNIENLWSLFEILTLRYLIVGGLRGFDKAGEQREKLFQR
jgi:hypothetical protein